MAAAGVTLAGADNNQQNAAVGAAKMADVVAVGAEVALAATAAAVAVVEAVAVAAAEIAAAAAIGMAVGEGKMRGRGRDWVYVGIPRIQLGNYLVQSRVIFIVNAYLLLSHFFASRQMFTLSALQIDLSAHADKNGRFVCVSSYLHNKNTILQNRCADKKLRQCAKGKTFAQRPMHICVAAYFLKKSQPKSSFFSFWVRCQECMGSA